MSERLRKNRLSKIILALAIMIGGCQKKASEGELPEVQTPDTFPPIEQGSINFDVPFVKKIDYKPSVSYYLRYLRSNHELKPLPGKLTTYRVKMPQFDFEDSELNEQLMTYFENEIDKIAEMELPAYPGIGKTLEGKILQGSIDVYCTQINSMLSCEMKRTLIHEEKDDGQNYYVNDSFYSLISLIDGHKITLKEVLNREDAYAYANKLFKEQFVAQLESENRNFLEDYIGDFTIDENTAFSLSSAQNEICIDFQEHVQQLYYNEFAVPPYDSLTIDLAFPEILPIYDLTYDAANDGKEENVIGFIRDYPKYIEKIETEKSVTDISYPVFLKEDEIFKKHLTESQNAFLDQFDLKNQAYVYNVYVSAKDKFYTINHHIVSDDIFYTFLENYYWNHEPVMLEDIFGSESKLDRNELYLQLVQKEGFSWTLTSGRLTMAVYDNRSYDPYINSIDLREIDDLSKFNEWLR